MDGEIRNLMVVGVDLVGLARSAKRAGYRVYAVDYFCDLDLRAVCEECLSVRRQEIGVSAGGIKSDTDSQAFLRMAKSMSENHQIDATLISSGLDDHPDVLNELNGLAEIVGNHPDAIRRVRRRESFFGELRRLEIPHPVTSVVHSLEEAESSAKDVGFPVVLKPLEGFAGLDVRKAEGPRQLETMLREVESISGDGVVIQEHIPGTPASISLMASRSGSEILSINEQLLGLREVHQREPYGYCGNIVPLRIREPTAGACEHIVEKVSSHFNLRGSNGVDIVIRDDGNPYVIEVNPRFQGTLECVERYLGANLVKMHIDACIHDHLTDIPGMPTGFITRLILYAQERAVAPDLTAFEDVRDIPSPGGVIEEGGLICSVITEGRSRLSSFKRSLEKAYSIYGVLFQTIQRE